MTAYYNEIDEDAAEVLRELIRDDVIAPGDVDTRSIKDVQPDDLSTYTQCHFFAGGGLWSLAARFAGWGDERPIWTGSCPCQPFSSAGQGKGTDDPRHLWPDFRRLIRAARPPVIMGEQVAGKAGYGWFDGVRSDLAGEGYASRAVDFPACSVDAPHQRNRLYWIAMGDGDGAREDIHASTGRPWPATGEPDGRLFVQPDTDRGGCHGRQETPQRGEEQRTAAERTSSFISRNGSWWADAEWLISPIDGKARRAKPGIPFLVDGLPGRVGLWRIAGNAISPIIASEVIAALRETLDERLRLTGAFA